jgi:hypothetical protein
LWGELLKRGVTVPDIVVEFVPAAFKHGVSEADIYFAFEHFLYID